ncbi:MAG: DUF937 domain-containing protein [Proteobacteria bacterium]|nr:DUF937 domain-containing protein [Pseudomonadota bacterium]
MNLNDMFANAYGPDAFQDMAKQFGLSVEQTQAAVNAMLPAFSAGLQQQMQTPDGLANLFSMMGQGQPFAAYAAPQAAMMKSGQEFMQQIFEGSQAQTRQVQDQMIQQAAAFSGIGSSILAKMMPIIASMIMGALFKGASDKGLGDLLGQVLGGGGMFGQPGQPTQTHPGSNPMGDLLNDMLGGAMGGSKAGAPADPFSAGIDILKGMFEQGKAIQDQQTQSMENIFDQILKANKPSA